MGVLDELNQRLGRGAVKLACAGVEATGERTSWAMRQERRSPAYTTCREDMLVVGDQAHQSLVQADQTQVCQVHQNQL